MKSLTFHNTWRKLDLRLLGGTIFYCEANSKYSIYFMFRCIAYEQLRKELLKAHFSNLSICEVFILTRAFGISSMSICLFLWRLRSHPSTDRHEIRSQRTWFKGEAKSDVYTKVKGIFNFSTISKWRLFFVSFSQSSENYY